MDIHHHHHHQLKQPLLDCLCHRLMLCFARFFTFYKLDTAAVDVFDIIVVVTAATAAAASILFCLFAVSFIFSYSSDAYTRFLVR